jgi:hypothetical protein
MKSAPLLLLAMAAPAMAHGGPSICPDCAAELCRARAEARLGCAELGPVMEHQRLLLNQQFLMRYNRGFVVAPTQPQAVVAPVGPEATPPASTTVAPRANAPKPRAANATTSPTDAAPTGADTPGDDDLPRALPPADGERGNPSR